MKVENKKGNTLNALNIFLAVVVGGIIIGLMGGLFLKALKLSGMALAWMSSTAQDYGFPGWLVAVMVGLIATSLAVWLADQYAPEAPQSAESERPTQVEKAKPNLNVITVNFLGTSLAVGSGLALGPERPAIQMGGAVGKWISRLFKLNKEDQEVLLAAAGGAGVATMFNSPLGCAAYTVETVLKRVNLRISLIALGIGAVAVAVIRLLLGRDVNFVVDLIPEIGLQYLFFIILLGCIIAVLASFHVHLTVFMKKTFRMLRFPPIVKAAIIGAIIGFISWKSPDMVGTGDVQTQSVINGDYTLSAMALLFGVRFFLGPFSLSANSPGGYFTPVLLLGALCGGIYSIVINKWLAITEISHVTFVLVGMAVALATIAKSPFTGILLVIETTGIFSLALPMIIAVAGATAVSRLLHSPPLSHGLENDLASVDQLHKNTINGSENCEKAF